MKWWPSTDAAGSAPLSAPQAGAGDRLVAEIDALKGAHDRWLADAVPRLGLSGLGMPEIGRYLAAWLSGPSPASPREGYSSVPALGVAVDDHLEATVSDGRPSSRQLGDCYGWGGTWYVRSLPHREPEPMPEATIAQGVE